MTINYIFCDIDGTLIKERETLTADFIQAVENVERQGIFFTFASGRLPYMIQPLLDDLGLPDHPYVACNGALIKKGDRTLYAKKFSLSLLKDIVEAALKEGMTVLYAIDEEEYLLAENSATMRKRRERGHYHSLRSLNSEEWDTAQIIKLNILKDDSLKNTDFLEPLLVPLAEQVLITHYGDYGLEIVAAGVNKLTGVELLLSKIGGSLSETAAIGDNENDSQLIIAAALGIAVANATPELAASADQQVSLEAMAGVIQALDIIRNEREGQ